MILLDERRARPEVAEDGQECHDDGHDRERAELGRGEQSRQRDRPDQGDRPDNDGPDDELPDRALPEGPDVEPDIGRTIAGRRDEKLGRLAGVQRIGQAILLRTRDAGCRLGLR